VPGDAPKHPDERERFTVSRRDWLHRVAGVGVGVGLATVARHRKLVPFLTPPEDLVPGVSTWYATSCRECPAGCGMIVRNREGRAVKCEGNPDHPINRGRLCARGQAALQGLYDPDRLRGPLSQGKPTTWDAALQTLGEALRPLRGTGRVAVMSDLQTGSLAALIRRWLELFGSDRYLVYEPFGYDSIREANRLLFGQPTIPVPSLDKADFILSFGADFLETWISPVQLTRQFAANRSARFVYVGPCVSLTAANAHERVLVRPGDERHVAAALLRVMLDEGLGKLFPLGEDRLAAHSAEAVAEATGVNATALRRIARAFAAARHPIALGGDPLAPQFETAAAACLLNLAAGSPGLDFGTVHALSEVAPQIRSRSFFADLEQKPVDVLLLIGANPRFSLGAAYDLQPGLSATKLVICLTPFADETAQEAHWVLPTHTPLESWGDYEPQTGVLNTMQPVMGALHDTRSAGDTLLALAKAAGFDPHKEFGAEGFRDYVFARWARRGPVEELLQRGGVWEAPKEDQRPLLPTAPLFSFTRPGSDDGLQLHAYPSTSLFDGRGANRRWLQELPDPITKVAWSSWVELNPKDAEKAGLQQGDLAQVALGQASVAAPVVVCPGVAEGTVAIPLGQGHTAYGRHAQGTGVNAFVLHQNPEDTPAGPPLTVVRLPQAGALLSADGSPYQHGRDIVRVVRASQLANLPKPALRLPLPEGYTREEDMVPPHQHRDHRWAMAIDLNRCTGCSACVTACYAENNVGVVGPERFAEHRAMAWIRIDRYYDWSDPAAPILFLPLMCQQCDAAPCETVCPVYAAAHSEEGLNMQVYNRCVGTRYCSNNCPYKVRRFNWFDWQWPEPLNWQANPDVTVRSRGVMEKCTFCIQRIREAEVRAKRENRALVDGEVTPACAQTCPAEAIVFGDLMDPNSRISRIVAEEKRAYQLLGELNTKPAVFYLKRVVDDEAAT
jgi:anaerobic selenocysteine-containing dehydrogenase/Fe-S-cluster-containing dehydrogenase component